MSESEKADQLGPDPERAAFERYFSSSRKSKGAGRRPTFERLGDGTYADNHTQRHWLTWQKSQENSRAAQDDAYVCGRRDECNAIADWLNGQGQPGYAHEVRHRA